MDGDARKRERRRVLLEGKGGRDAGREEGAGRMGGGEGEGSEELPLKCKEIFQDFKKYPDPDKCRGGAEGAGPARPGLARAAQSPPATMPAPPAPPAPPARSGATLPPARG